MSKLVVHTKGIKYVILFFSSFDRIIEDEEESFAKDDNSPFWKPESLTSF